MANYLKISANDNVIIALKDFKKDDVIDVENNQKVVLLSDVPKGHKIALTDIAKGSDVVKYNYAIGFATADIKKGEHVHVQNVKTKLSGTLDYTYNKVNPVLNIKPENITFNGYVRADGNVGVRNELWIIPTVGCVNAVVRNILNEFKAKYPTLEGVDHIEVFEHNYGCSQLGDDHANTRTILSNIVKHPNAGGVLVVGLGCENNQIAPFKEQLGTWDEKRVKFVLSQDVEDEVAEGLKLLEEIYATAKKDKRQPVPISKLKIGLECGGSDGFSGITANPLLGEFSDVLIANGGTSVLTEVPEMFGAEQILMDRCVSSDVFDKTVHMVNQFKDYFTKANQPIYENPSPGNKNGGITTLEDKSLGCTQKGGQSKVSEVYDYGEVIDKPGLVLLNSPGNDMVATTALAASGCQIVLFTTGRGTPFGGFVPTIKVATNSDIFNRKKHWFDFNAGVLLDGVTMPELLKEFSKEVLDICNGKPSRNEINNFRNMTIWKQGVTL